MTRLLQALGNFFTLEPDADKAIKEWLQTEIREIGELLTFSLKTTVLYLILFVELFRFDTIELTPSVTKGTG